MNKIRTKALPKLMRKNYFIEQETQGENLAAMKIKNYQDPFNLASYLEVSPQKFVNNLEREEPQDFYTCEYL